MSSQLPSNAHVSRHPCVRAKLSQLRSSSTDPKTTKRLIHDITLLVGAEALASGLDVVSGPTDHSPLGYEYTTETVSPSHISVMPILRSGLAMTEAVHDLLPDPVPTHHLGLFRDKSTMTAVEYYNNLPYHRSSVSSSSGPSDLTILVDPVIATGATACAAIDTLRDWGVKQIIMVCIIASAPGLKRAAEQWTEGVHVWAGGVDESTDANGMLQPGVGDIGDRLFLTIGR